ITSKFEFTNIKCIPKDEQFGNFECCYLKSVNRTYKYVTIKYYFNKLPITSIQVNVALFKRFNGYKPFLYNVTVDGCKFLKNQKSNPIMKFFFETIDSFSNINHSCPYNHGIIFDKLTIEAVNRQFTKILPFSEGDYMVEINWMSFEKLRAVTMFYGTLS
ncbi:hypothetical protein KR074_012098, partial [Drosophila pseudoananassae]